VKTQFGYFDYAGQEQPTYDPGLDVECLVCGEILSSPMVTPSLMLEGDNRSYFYRLHKHCSDGLSPEQESEVDGLLLDTIIKARNNLN